MPTKELRWVLEAVWKHEIKPHSAWLRAIAGRRWAAKKYEEATEEPVEVGGMDDAVEAVKEGKMDLHTANIALQQLEPYKGYYIVSETLESREGTKKEV